MSSKEIKEKIINDINKLSEKSLMEIMDFISFKLSNDTLKGENKFTTKQQLDLSKDPLLEYIGSIENGSLAKDIDKELYGEIH